MPILTKILIGRLRQDYNTIMPRIALGYQPPAPEARWVGRMCKELQENILWQKHDGVDVGVDF
jgi:hypothetical protein